MPRWCREDPVGMGMLINLGDVVFFLGFDGQNMCRDDVWKSPVASEMVVGCGCTQVESYPELPRTEWVKKLRVTTSRIM